MWLPIDPRKPSTLNNLQCMVVIGELICSGNGPIAVSSMFGWFLHIYISGPVKYQGNRVGYAISNLAVEGSKAIETIGYKSELDDRLYLFWDTEQLASPKKSKAPFCNCLSIWLDLIDIKLTCCGKWIIDLLTMVARHVKQDLTSKKQDYSEIDHFSKSTVTIFRHNLWRT